MQMLPTTPTSQWSQGLDFPSRVFGNWFGEDEVELYEEDGEFVLTIEMPGFDRDEMSVSWDEGRLYVAAEHEDETRNRRQTYHRTFRLPKEIEPDEIDAAYRNGVLEVRLPIIERTTVRGQEIEIK